MLLFNIEIIRFFTLPPFQPTNLSSSLYRVSENTVSSVDIVNLPTYGSACLPLSKSSLQIREMYLLY
jgi:hypothetical protein